jgi:hypothetical protein
MLFQLFKGSDLLFIPGVSSDAKTQTVRASTPTQAFMSMRQVAAGSLLNNVKMFPDYFMGVLIDVLSYAAVPIRDIYTPHMYVPVVRKSLLQGGVTNITVHGIDSPDTYLDTLLLPILDSTADYDTLNSDLTKLNFSLFMQTLANNGPILNDGATSPFICDQEECDDNMHVFTLVKE